MTDAELIYIKTIIEEKSLSKAAEKLFISQPSLSKNLLKIETQLGTKLFTRTNTGLVPTYAGKRYYKIAKDILKIYKDFEIEISDINELKKGKITVGITPQLATYMLPIILPIFKQKYPNIEIVIAENSTAELERSLSAGEIDFAIMFLPPLHEANNILNIDYEFVFKDSLLLVTSQEHPLSIYKEEKENLDYPWIDLLLFSNEPFILEDHGLRIRQVTELIFHKANINPKIAFTTKSFETARRLVSQGLGITFIPKRYIDIFPSIYLQNYFYIDEQYSPYWNLCIAILNDAYISIAAKEFIKIVKEEFKEHKNKKL